jgi:hypothetical protein
MQLLETIVIDHVLYDKYVEIMEGDITAPLASERADVLVISANPDDYLPTRRSVIGALNARGLSVQQLSRDKEFDLRRDFACWLSKPISPELNLPFTRILCFEPGASDDVAERIADIFRALAPFVGDQVTSVVMPLVTCGDRGGNAKEVVEPLIRAASYWLRASRLHRVRVVTQSPESARMLHDEARRIKAKIQAEQVGQKDYDVFLSYSRKNSMAADIIESTLRELAPSLRIFRDTRELRVGLDYRVQRDRALRGSRKFVPVLTREYVVSNPCQDEFNAAWNIRDQIDPKLFFPLFVRTIENPEPRIGKLHYHDCTEENPEKLRNACALLVSELGAA